VAAFIKKLAVDELVKKFPVTSGTRNIIYHSHKGLPLIPILSETKTVQPFTWSSSATYLF